MSWRQYFPDNTQLLRAFLRSSWRPHAWLHSSPTHSTLNRWSVLKDAGCSRAVVSVLAGEGFLSNWSLHWFIHLLIKHTLISKHLWGTHEKKSSHSGPLSMDPASYLKNLVSASSVHDHRLTGSDAPCVCVCWSFFQQALCSSCAMSHSQQWCPGVSVPLPPSEFATSYFWQLCIKWVWSDVSFQF